MIKRRIYFLVVCAVCFFFGAFILLEEPPIKETVQTSSMEDYDIILIAGRSFRSRIIRFFGGGVDEWSHVGVLRKENNQVFLLHATPDTRDGNAIQYEPLNTLIERNAVSNFRIIRLTGLTPAQWDIVRYKFEEIKMEKRPFDYTFNMQDQSRIYCSELVLIVFAGFINDVKTNRTIHPGVFEKLVKKD